MKEKRKPIIYFILGVISTCIVTGSMFGSNLSLVEAKENIKQNNLNFPIHVNGKPITLNDTLLLNDRTYVQLREFSEKINVDVNWVDPNYHMAPVPGGNFPGGINLTNPTFIYTKTVTDYYDTGKTIKGVEITSVYNKYKAENKKLNYAFDDLGLVIRENGQEKKIPLKINPSNGRKYLSVSEFKEKLLPYFVEMCMQEVE